MLFLTANQQCQSTEGRTQKLVATKHSKQNCRLAWMLGCRAYTTNQKNECIRHCVWRDSHFLKILWIVQSKQTNLMVFGTQIPPKLTSATYRFAHPLPELNNYQQHDFSSPNFCPAYQSRQQWTQCVSCILTNPTQALQLFSAVTPLVGSRKGIRPVKNWVVGCWRGYLSGARCRLAYGPADATATHCLLLQYFSKINIGFIFLVPAHPGSPGKNGR